MAKKENKRHNKKEGHFDVPEGYFQKSSIEIYNKIEWEEEMQSFALLYKLKEKNCFIVPDSYFDKNEIKLEKIDFKKLATIKQVNPFQIPNNYFENSRTNILFETIVKENELTETPFLDQLPKQNNFKIPSAYFEKNKLAIRNLLSEKNTNKIIQLSFSKMAMAAAAILVISIGAWIYKSYNQKPINEDCGTLACIERRELLKSKQLENIDAEELYELVNPNSLEHGLQIENSIQTNKIDSNTKNNINEDLLEEI